MYRRATPHPLATPQVSHATKGSRWGEERRRGGERLARAENDLFDRIREAMEETRDEAPTGGVERIHHPVILPQHVQLRRDERGNESKRRRKKGKEKGERRKERRGETAPNDQEPVHSSLLSSFSSFSR